MDAVTHPPTPANEPVRGYAPGSPERAGLERRIKELAGERAELTGTIGGRQRMAGGDPIEVVQPHRHRAVLGTTAQATDDDVRDAVDAALAAGPSWRDLPYDERAAVLLRAAELLAGPWRDTLNAATVLGQSKSGYQAEIDAAAELIDFLRFNVHFGHRFARRAAGLGAGRVEPDGPPAAGGLRPRDHPVQLHRDRGQPAARAGPDGQHGGLEAVAHPAARRALHDAAAGGGRPAARRGQHGDRRRARGLRGGTAASQPRRGPLHRLHRAPSGTSGPPSPPASSATAATPGWSARPVARTSWSPTPAPSRRRSSPPWSAARSSTRGRSARPPPARTSRVHLWDAGVRDELAAGDRVDPVRRRHRPVRVRRRGDRPAGVRAARRRPRPGRRATRTPRCSPAARPTTRTASSSSRRW